MRVVIVGLGVQGRKRLAVAGADVVATVDPVAPEARYQAIEEVPRDAYDAALLCTPDQAKLALMRFLLAQGKHVLVEKPLLADEEHIRQLAASARAAGVACYTAYNHRFEPHLVRLKSVLEAGTIGPVYLMRGFYGNGTARDIQQSPWRDQGLGVLADLGSHLLDLVLWLLGPLPGPFTLWQGNRFENRAFDHVLFGSMGKPAIVLEGALVSWRNAFALDVYGSRGSAHVHGLCKWGPSHFILRRRVLPSGKPTEDACTLECPDPTWALEYQHFRQLCVQRGATVDNDLWINRALNGMVCEIEEVSGTFPALKSV